MSDSTQQQFLTVISREEATARLRENLSLLPIGIETIAMDHARQRVLAEDVISGIDVPGFDRSNVDGFAVQASDTFGAMEEFPALLKLNSESLLPGRVPSIVVHSGTATPISTGGILPRGADAVVMIEDTEFVHDEDGGRIEVKRAAVPGQMISFAGSDIAKGETVLWTGTPITSRELGVIAALGRIEVTVFQKPRVALVSTGDEVVGPGEPLPMGAVYDSNAVILAAAVSECGGEPIFLGRVKDDETALREMVRRGLEFDLLLLSGGTSKGAGDLSYRVIEEFSDPGIIAHGVALKPGKPICMAVTNGKLVVILPGFPTSAIFTFQEFVAPVIRSLAGLPHADRPVVPAKIPTRIHSDRGRTEFVLVRLFGSPDQRIAYPMGKGSGSVTTFSLADGFVTIPQNCEMLDAGELVSVTLLDQDLKPADLVVIGSHCVGLDTLLGQLHRLGLRTSTMHVGSEAGLAAIQRGECDLAGVHLLDPQTQTYNTPFLNDDLELIAGYRRMQSFVYRSDDKRFDGLDYTAAMASALSDPSCCMVNRNSGSGTRILTDILLAEVSGTPVKPRGYNMQVKSHNAVAAAISQHRADWGIAIESVAKNYGLCTLPIREEHYDFVIRRANSQKPAIVSFRRLLDSAEGLQILNRLGFARS